MYFRSVSGEFRDLRSKIYTINNLTFTYPPSPVLTQPDDMLADLPCNELNMPEKCNGKLTSLCECFHVEYIPLGATTEIILIDRGRIKCLPSSYFSVLFVLLFVTLLSG